MKGVLSLNLCLAVFAAFCAAPFVHFHLNDTSHARQTHQGKGFGSHAHGGQTACSHNRGAAEVVPADGSDDDAVFLTWVQTGPQTGPVVVAALPVFSVLAAPSFAKVGSATVPVPRSHGPPQRGSGGPRSPPPFKPLPAV